MVGLSPVGDRQVANRTPPHRTSNDLIVEGARQNNLKNISLRIPHDKVTAITGLSGSGKSSLAFDTLVCGRAMALCGIPLDLCAHVSRQGEPPRRRSHDQHPPGDRHRAEKSDSHGPFHRRNRHGTRRPATAALRQNRQTRLPGLQSGSPRLPSRVIGRGIAGPISRRAGDDFVPRQGPGPRP